MGASLPDSQFRGFDLSPVQIEMAKKLARDVGVDNVQFDVGDILDIADLGTFDFVIAHGVYSWVPPVVRDALLALVQRCLAPHGVGFISYNTFPGWGTRAPVRDLMQFAGRTHSEPADVIASGRSVLTLAARLAPQGPHRDMLRQHEKLLADLPDGYVFHDFLSHINEPVWFTDFAEHLAAHNLSFLSEATFSDVMGADLHPDASPIIQGMPDRLRREQYKDFLKNRGFRSSLVVHAQAEPDYRPTVERIAPLRVNSLVEAVDELDLTEGVEVDFKDRDGRMFGTSRALLKAALLELNLARPRNMPVEEVIVRSRARLGRGADTRSADRAALLKNLFYLYTKKLCDLQQRTFMVASELTDRPRASVLARIAIEQDAFYIANGRHESVVLGGRFERALLQLLDGERDRDQLVDALVEVILGGGLSVKTEAGEIIDDREILVDAMQTALPDGLEALRLLALVEA